MCVCVIRRLKVKVRDSDEICSDWGRSCVRIRVSPSTAWSVLLSLFNNNFQPHKKPGWLRRVRKDIPWNILRNYQAVWKERRKARTLLVELRSGFKISRNSLVYFTGIATVNIEMYSDIIHRPKDAVRRKFHTKKMENQQFVCPSQQCSSSPVGFGQEFLCQERCDNTGASVSLPGFLDWNQHWRDNTVVMLLTSVRMQRRSWKGCHEMASRNVSNSFTIADKRV